jgi:valyl-tRNA synthetase
MEVYQFGAASSILYDFVYDDFCSYYLEMSKVALTHPENEAACKGHPLQGHQRDYLADLSVLPLHRRRDVLQPPGP